MKLALVLFSVGMVWFYARFLRALLRDRPRRHVSPIRLRNDSRVSPAEEKEKSGLGRVA